MTLMFRVFGFFILIFFISIEGNAQKLLKETNKYRNGKLYSSEKFDSAGNVILRTTFYDSQMQLNEEFYFVNGKLMFSVFRVGIPTIELHYHYVNDKLRYVSYLIDGVNSKTTVYDYDENGKVLVETESVHAGSLIQRTNYLYNTEGHISEKQMLHEDGRVFLVKFSYNDSGFPVEEIQIAGTDTLRRMFWKYDAFNRMIEQLETASGEFVQRNMHQYNKSGQLSGILYLDEYGMIVRNETFTYNAQGLTKQHRIIDYRNFEGKMNKSKDVMKYKYKFY